MSHEYMACRECDRPVKEHLMNHTEKGSFCDACYKKLGLEQEVEFEVCSQCGEKFLQRNFKVDYPDDICGLCGEAQVRAKQESPELPLKDVPFSSDENQARDIVLGFIHDKSDKRVGMRILHRGTNKVVPYKVEGDWFTWNLNIRQGNLYPKCCKLTDFPILSLPAGVDGNPMDTNTKLVTKVSGAWVLEEVGEGKFRLVSVSGQMKDVTEETAMTFHNAYKIANAVVEDGKLSGTFKKYEKDYGTDVFELFGDGRVHWIYYNPDGNGGNGQYVETNFDTTIIQEASTATTEQEFFDFIGMRSKQYLIDNDGSDDFEQMRQKILTEDYNLRGCTAETMKALKTFAGVNSVEDEDKFFIVPEKGYVEWIRKAKGSSKFFVANFYAHKLPAVSNGDLSAGEYFKQLASSILQDKTITSMTLSEGDSEYSTVRTRYLEGNYTLAGANDKTKAELVALANSLNSRFYPVGEALSKDGYLVMWVTYSNANGNDRFDIVYMTRDAILSAASKKLNYVEFFDDTLYAVAGYVVEGDEPFDSLVKLFAGDSAKWIGVSEETMSGIISYAKEALGTPSTTSNGKSDDLSDSEDIRHMKALNEELKAACKAYYGDGNSPLSDLEYDEKFDKLLALEHKTGVVLPDSVTQGVGADITGKLPKVEHAEKLLSLDKTKEIPTLQALLNQDPDGVGILSWKLDGLTILATYDNGVLKNAATRGNGRIGEDVTHNAKFFKGLPRRIPYKGKLRVRGEAVISYSTFERINANLPEGQEPYKNPRNLVSGLVRRSEVTRDGSVEFFPFGVSIDDEKFRPKVYSQSLRFLAGQGFTPVEYRTCISETVTSIVENFKKNIETFDYPTDGLVLMLDDLVLYESLGSTGRHPKGAIAFKWADERQTTTLRSIEWSASRTGVLTPVAIFDPVELEGTTVQRASVHNLTMVKSLQLGLGDRLRVYKANMIIPQIAENLTKSGTVTAPANCPVCGGVTSVRQDGAAEVVICTNPDCAAKNVGLLVHFAKRDAMNIDGISDKTVEVLVSAGYLGKPADFYKLKNHPEIAKLPGWGSTSYNKLLYAIDNSRRPRLANFIYSLGIRNVGRSASESIAKHFKSIDAFIGATAEQISTVDGVGAGMTADIVAYLSTHRPAIQELASLISIVNPDQEVTQSVVLPTGVPQGVPGCLSDLVFCVTGKVEFPGARTGLARYIESLGGRMSSSVTKNTDYLITNTPSSGTTKNQAAQRVGCKIISEKSFYLLVEELSANANTQEDASDIDDGIADFGCNICDERIKEPAMIWFNGCETGLCDACADRLTEDEREDLHNGVNVGAIIEKYQSSPTPEPKLNDSKTKQFPRVEELTEEFNKVYDILYKSRDTVASSPSYKEALNEGNKFFEEHPAYLIELARYRGDVLSSDREIVAFIMALRNLTMTEGERAFQQMIDAVDIPDDPRESRIQAATAIQALTGVPLAGLTFCVTGKVNYGTRVELHNFIESKGGKVASSVTKGVDYLITNTPFSNTTKNKAARANGCRIISEADFMDLVHTGKQPSDFNKREQPESPYETHVYESVKGKTFCITGRVNFPGKRAALQAYIRSLGGYNADTVDYGVDYLITNDPFSGSTKNKLARRMVGCKIITEEQFLEMANK